MSTLRSSRSEPGGRARAVGHAGPLPAFWSDTAERYRALPLFAVRPGDLTATLRAAGDGWRVRIVDRTSGVRRTFTTTRERPPGFDVAEYVQELPIDPGRISPRKKRRSLIHFGDLEVNGALIRPVRRICARAG